MAVLCRTEPAKLAEGGDAVASVGNGDAVVKSEGSVWLASARPTRYTKALEGP